MACLPPATTIYILATQHNVYVLRASAAIYYGTLCAVVTIPGVLYLISNDLLPADLFDALR